MASLNCPDSSMYCNYTEDKQMEATFLEQKPFADYYYYEVHPAMIYNAVVESLMGLVALVGNALVIFLVSTRPHLRSITGMYILNRVIADLFYVCIIPISLTTLTKNIGPLMCHFVLSCLNVGVSASHAFLVFLAIDCYLAGRKNRHTVAYRWKVLKISTGVTWGLVAIFAVMYYLSTTVDEDQVVYGRQVCFLHVMFSEFVMGLMCYYLFYIVHLTVVWVYVDLIFSPNVTTAEGVGGADPDEREVDNSDMTRISYQSQRRLVLGLAVVFTVCRVLYQIIMLMLHHVIYNEVIFCFTYSLQYIYLALNVVMIFWLHDNFRQELMKLVGRSHSRGVALVTL